MSKKETGDAYFKVIPPMTGHEHTFAPDLLPVQQGGTVVYQAMEIPAITITDRPTKATAEQAERLRASKHFGRIYREVDGAEMERERKQAEAAERERRAAEGVVTPADLDRKAAEAKAAFDHALKLQAEFVSASEAAAGEAQALDYAEHPAYYTPEAQAEAATLNRKAADADAGDVEAAERKRREAEADAARLADEASHPAGNTVPAVAEKGGSANTYPSVTTVQQAAVILADKHAVVLDDLKGKNGQISKSKVQEAAGKVGAAFPGL